MSQNNQIFTGTIWTMLKGQAYTRIEDGSALWLQTEHFDGATIAVKLWLLTESGWALLHKLSEGINNPGFYHDPIHADKRLAEVREQGSLVRDMMDYAALLYGDRLYLPDCTEVSAADRNLVHNYWVQQKGKD